MGEIPEFLLVDEVTVEPYVSWGVWSAPEPLQCRVDESLVRSQTTTGVQQVAQVRIYAKLDANCPSGSKVTLADGRKGYAADSVRQTTNGQLPTPDHIQVAVAIGEVVGPAFGETVVLIRREVVGRDRYNNDRYADVEHTINATAVRVLDSKETGASTTVTSIEVLFPPNTAVTSVDRVRVRGLEYAVSGVPEVLTSPETGTNAGVRVIGRRTTG